MLYKYPNNQIHNIDNSQLISDGKTADGNVYREGELAIKIVHSPHMTLIKAKEFCRLNTKYILLPRCIVYDKDDKYVGYGTEYVQPIKNGLLHIPSTVFIDNIHGLKKDIDLLDENNILMDDIHEKNTIEGEKLYFIDTDRYHKKDRSEDDIANIDKLNSVVERIIIEKFSLYLGKGTEARQLMRNILFNLDKVLDSPEIFIEREFSKYKYVSDYFEQTTRVLQKNRDIKLFGRN